MKPKTKAGICGIIASVIIVVIFSFNILQFIQYFEEENSFSFFLKDVIFRIDKLNKELDQRTLVMKEKEFSDPNNFEEIQEIQAELGLVKEKLIEIRNRLKNKHRTK